jgi:hypothetical protein
MRRRSEQQPRNQAVTVKLSSSEKTAIQSAAATRRLSVGAYIAEVGLAAAGRTVPVHNTERQLLIELMPVAHFLKTCWGQLYEAIKRQEASGVQDPDLKSILARVEQSCDKADAVTIKVSWLLPGLHRKRQCLPRPRGQRGAAEYLCISWFRLDSPLRRPLVDAQVHTFEPVAELPPLRWVDVQRLQFARGEPSGRRRLVVGCRLAGEQAAEQDDLVLLADLAVGVGDDVTRVGVNAEQPGHLDRDAGLLERLAHSALGDGLSELLLAYGDRPLAGVAAPLEQHAAALVDGQDPGCGDEAVRPRRGRVVQVLDTSYP